LASTFNPVPDKSLSLNGWYHAILRVKDQAMKNLTKSSAAGMVVLCFLLLSCHPTHFVVGKGPQQHQVAQERNKFLFLGLKHVGTAPDPSVMSKQATDYKITVKLTFSDVLLNVVTLGIYSPLTVQVEY
jgi:hypothetical protein